MKTDDAGAGSGLPRKSLHLLLGGTFSSFFRDTLIALHSQKTHLVLQYTIVGISLYLTVFMQTPSKMVIPSVFFVFKPLSLLLNTNSIFKVYLLLEST